jgi:hypothetical protein
VGIRDVTPLAQEIRAHVRAGELARTTAPLPRELPYPAGMTRRTVGGGVR